MRVADAASWAHERDPERALLFIYGSLMRGFELYHYMMGATFIGQGRVQGTLVSLGRYPGLIAGAGDVHGELYQLEDPAQLEALDDLEEYDPERPEQSEYTRTEREIRLDDGRTCSAWVYIYNRDTKGCPVIVSGDWHRRGSIPSAR
ncbi:MAG: gamma-glutamylcyclotransferase [Candidatus Eremiobacteraeota bacterium]|nr:gamma-glutamylcyclotransferase [Candidatus Eremiobacteraeota bacterium]